MSQTNVSTVSPLPGTLRVRLEELSVERHLEAFHEMWSNPNALIWSTQEAKKTLAESQAWLEPMIKFRSGPRVASYAIMLQGKGFEDGLKMIGTVGVHGIAEVEEGQRCEIGYMINHDYWGRGYGSEAVGEFLHLWFNDTNHTEEDLVAQVDTENWASMRILQKMAERGYGIRKGELNKATFRNSRKGLRDMRVWYISKRTL